jgi:biotin carboxyl carrier protein
MKLELYNRDRKVDVEVTPLDDDLQIAFEGKEFKVRMAQPSNDGAINVDLNGKSLRVILEEETEKSLKLRIDGESLVFSRAQVQFAQSGAATTSAVQTVEADALVSPLYGKIVSVDVKAGDLVETGGALLSVEAMKMESVIRAESKRKVKEVLVKEGEGVKKGQVLIRFAQE